MKLQRQDTLNNTQAHILGSALHIQTLELLRWKIPRNSGHVHPYVEAKRKEVERP